MPRANFLFSKNKYIPLLSFVTVSFVFAVLMITENVFPFGDQCILRTDMYHQYAPFFKELKEKLSSGGSLFFTWDLGLGVNFLAVIAYYLASPLNLLLYFVSSDNVIEFMTFLIIVKSSLAAATMAVYLGSVSDGNPAGAYIVSLFYGLSGYMCAYYWNIMWLDAIYMFPIVVLGLKRLTEGKSGVVYGLALGFTIFTNYYIAIPICIFLVIYFFLLSFLYEPESPAAFAANGLRFAGYSLLAGGIAAVLLLPEIYAFTLSASSTNVFPTSVTDYFPMLSELARHLPFTETEQGLDHWPNIYCGTFAIPFFFLYISNRRISLKEKAVYIGLSFFLLTGFAVNLLNFLWHGLHYPNSLPARQSFLYIFLVLTMCFRVLVNLRAVSRKDLGRAFGFSAAFILLVQQIVKDDAFSIMSYYPALILVSIYIGLLYMYKAGYLRRGAAMAGILFLAVTEVAANTGYTSVTTTSRTSFTADNEAVEELLSYAEDNTEGFYRVERVQRKSKNDGAWLSFPSASFFSSTVNADLTAFFKRMGCEASTNAYSITGSTPLVDMLLGIKYSLSSNAYDETDISRIAARESGMYLYENVYALSPAFVMPEAMASEWMTDIQDPAIVQNSLADALRTDQILIPVYNGASSVDGEVAVTISESGLYYAYEGNTDAGDITVRWTDRKKTFSNLDRGYFLELGVLDKGELVNFSAAKSGYDPQIIIYKVNTDAVRQIYEALSSAELKIIEYGDGYLKGIVSVDPEALGYAVDRARMLVTVPFDEGFTVYVDGAKTDISKGVETFLSFYISGGTHEVIIRYEPVGFKKGLVISIASLGIFIIIIVLNVMRGKGKAVNTSGKAHRDDNTCLEGQDKV